MSYTIQHALIYLGLPAAFGGLIGLAAYFYNKNYADDSKMMWLESLVVGIMAAVLMWFIIRSVAGLSA